MRWARLEFGLYLAMIYLIWNPHEGISEEDNDKWGMAQLNKGVLALAPLS